MTNSLRSFRDIGHLITLLLLGALWLITGCSLFQGGSEDPAREFSDVPTGPGSGSSWGTNQIILGGDPGKNSFGIDDIVIVNFSGLDTATPTAHQERVKDDGTITLQLIGAVKALGKTPGELQKEIRQLYVPKYYNPNLNVTVTGENRYFYVQGRVKAPNRYPYGGDLTVTKAIAAAGDFDDFANRKKVVLTRSDGKKYTVNCVKAINDSALDLKVYPNDKIFVPQRYW